MTVDQHVAGSKPGVPSSWKMGSTSCRCVHDCVLFRRRPYRVECTGSLSTSEVKQHRARLVLGWGTAWEDLRVLSAFPQILVFTRLKVERAHGWMARGWGEGSPPHRRAKSHTLVRAAVSVWKRERRAQPPARQPSCNLPNTSSTVARLQLTFVRTERQKQRLYLHRIIALVMT